MKIGKYRLHWMFFIYVIGIILLFLSYALTQTLLGLVLLAAFVYILVKDWDDLVRYEG